MKYIGYEIGDKVWCTVMQKKGIIKDIKINEEICFFNK